MSNRPANEQWEYKFAHREDGFDATYNDPRRNADIRSRRTAWLNDFGADGWEVIKLEYGTNEHMAVVMKRRRGY